MNISSGFISLLESLEGKKRYRYRDTEGNWTIGRGHLIKPGETFNEPMSDEDMDRQTRNDVAFAEHAVNKRIKVPLTQNQFDALTSFAFNVGEGGLLQSRVLRLVNQRDYLGAAEWFASWNKITDPDTGLKKVDPGLVNRRAKEKALFLTPDEA